MTRHQLERSVYFLLFLAAEHRQLENVITKTEVFQSLQTFKVSSGVGKLTYEYYCNLKFVKRRKIGFYELYKFMFVVIAEGWLGRVPAVPAVLGCVGGCEACELPGFGK